MRDVQWGDKKLSEEGGKSCIAGSCSGMTLYTLHGAMTASNVLKFKTPLSVYVDPPQIGQLSYLLLEAFLRSVVVS
jgi:hypothetical protein